MAIRSSEIPGEPSADQEVGIAKALGGQFGIILLLITWAVGLCMVYELREIGRSLLRIEQSQPVKIIGPSWPEWKEVPNVLDDSATTQPSTDLHEPQAESRPPVHVRQHNSSWRSRSGWADCGGGAVSPDCAAAAPLELFAIWRNAKTPERPGPDTAMGRSFQTYAAASSFILACQRNEAAVLLRGRAVAAHRPHKPKVAGSIPASASGRDGR